MPKITYKSLNKDARTATFTVDGEDVTRHIPAQFAGTIDDYLLALAQGLAVEFAPVEVRTIETPTKNILIQDEAV